MSEEDPWRTMPRRMLGYKALMQATLKEADSAVKEAVEAAREARASADAAEARADAALEHYHIACDALNELSDLVEGQA